MVVSTATLDPHDAPEPPPLLLLPGFDEFLLGVKDRSAVLAPGDLERVIPGRNGVFVPTIVADGKVIGTWKRQSRARHVDIVAAPCAPLTTAQQDEPVRVAQEYAACLGPKRRCRWRRADRGLQQAQAAVRRRCTIPNSDSAVISAAPANTTQAAIPAIRPIVDHA